MENTVKKPTVHTVFTAIFGALALIAFVLFAIMFGEFLVAVAEQSTATGGSEQLGVGLSVAFALVFMLILAVIDIPLSITSLVLSLTLIRRASGGRRIYAIISSAASGFFILSTVAAFAVAMLIK